MAKFDNILIATDLDGTLYENQNFIPQINLDKIKYFTDNGGKFTIATGNLSNRPYGSQYPAKKNPE